MSEQWVLLWSMKQNAIHIEPLEKMLSSNRLAYRENRSSDYIPLYVGERAHVDAAAGFCHATLTEREFGLAPLRAEV
jgi:hypothetical protein